MCMFATNTDTSHPRGLTRSGWPLFRREEGVVNGAPLIEVKMTFKRKSFLLSHCSILGKCWDVCQSVGKIKPNKLQVCEDVNVGQNTNSQKKKYCSLPNSCILLTHRLKEPKTFC